MTNFNDFNISNRVKESLVKMGYEKPTDVQSQAIPAILDGKDVLVSSQTGTGKTGAFLIPLLTILDNNKGKVALVVAPTRELAKQVYTVAAQMMGSRNALALLIGGDSMPGQIRQIKSRPKLIVGTPGRINDHLSKRKSLKLDNAHYLVLDETDRMLDMGFGIQIDEILTHMPAKRQTVMFSATLPKGIVKVAGKYLNNPLRITSGEENSIADKINQIVVKTENRFDELLNILEKAAGSVLVFARTQRNVEQLSYKLQKSKDFTHSLDFLHGGLRQNKREKVMKHFRNSKFKVLVATDVASRGLDVPHIDHVVNYDLPDAPEDYIHRIGRTARAEKSGTSIALVSGKDENKWRAIQRFLKGEDAEPVSRNSRRRKKKKGKGGNPFATAKRGNSKKEYRPKRHSGKNDSSTGEKSNNFHKKSDNRKRSDGNTDNKEKRDYSGKKDYSSKGKSSGKKDYTPRGESSDRSEKRDFSGKKDYSSKGKTSDKRDFSGKKDYSSKGKKSKSSRFGKPNKQGNSFNKNKGKKKFNKS